MGEQEILVIEDDPLVSKSVEKCLTGAGYNTVCTSNASEAISEFKKKKYNLIISDIRMPGKNGVETIQEIREIANKNGQEDIPIIFITGYAEQSMRLNAEFLGEVIVKPFDLEHLLTTIREYL